MCLHDVSIMNQVVGLYFGWYHIVSWPFGTIHLKFVHISTKCFHQIDQHINIASVDDANTAYYSRYNTRDNEQIEFSRTSKTFLG